MLRQYEWRLNFTATNVEAICEEQVNGVAVSELHRLVIMDEPASEVEAMGNAKTLLKMRCLKDVLTPHWDNLEAAIYAIKNQNWLDNKLIDAARRRWGAAHYIAECWLMAGVLEIAPESWSTTLDTFLPLSDDTLLLRSRLETFKKMPSSVGCLNNWLTLQTPALSQQYTHHRYWNHEWVSIDGVALQKLNSPKHGGIIMLLNDGKWLCLLTGGIESSLDTIQMSISEGPPTIEELQKVKPSLPYLEAEKLVQLS